MTTDTVVVGGGIAGLTYAWKFAQYQKSKTNKNKTIPISKLCLFEKKHFFGGRIESFDLDSKLFLELGPSRFNDTHTQLQLLLQELEIEFSEYKASRPVITFRQPLTEGLLDEQDVKSLKNQILTSYPTLILSEIKLLEKFDFQMLDLLLALVKEETWSSNTNLWDFVQGRVGPRVAQICKDATGCDSFWQIQMPEARYVIEEMFSRERKWYRTKKEPLCHLVKKIILKLIQEYSDFIELKLGCAVVDIQYDQKEKVYALNHIDPRRKACAIKCKNLVLATDLPSLKKLFEPSISNLVTSLPFKENPQLSLNHLRAFPVLKIFAQFPIEPQIWYDQKRFPVLYSAMSCKVIFPTSNPGMLCFTYTDGQDTQYWQDLLTKSQPREVSPQVYKIDLSLSSPSVPIMAAMRKELEFLLPRAEIPNPLYILAHLCQVMFPVTIHEGKKQLSLSALPDNLRPRGSNFAVIGEAVAIYSDLGVTSAWLESGIRSAIKGFNHMMSKSQIQVL